MKSCPVQTDTGGPDMLRLLSRCLSKLERIVIIVHYCTKPAYKRLDLSKAMQCCLDFVTALKLA